MCPFMQKEKRSIAASVLLILFGMLLLFYPFISEYLFEHRVNSEIIAYRTSVDDLGREQYQRMFEEARLYNQTLTESQVTLTDPFIAKASADDVEYGNLISVDDAGIMAYVEIPAIDVYLPVYHGTSADVLKNGVGHLEGTSLPVGGEDSHTVLTGHTGLNNARLFTDLTEVAKGDLFFIHVLGDTLAYQVREINVVLTEETDKLLICRGRDLATLVTCTPYGMNTHRLLVTGERVEYSEEKYTDAVDNSAGTGHSQWMSSYKKAIMAGIMLTFMFFAGTAFWNKIKHQRWTGAALISMGMLLCLSPVVQTGLQAVRTRQFVDTFHERYDRTERIAAADDKTGTGNGLMDGETDPLYLAVEAYNQSIYESGQENFLDPWSYEQVPVTLEGLEDSVFGYIEIPKMHQILPLYIGASSEHMAEGAAVLGQTSIPIGGENTNSVIAGHRGYSGQPFFKEIENLEAGDKVLVTNPWETLTYIVASIDIIDPYNVDAVKIQADRDMITLLTCHPYASGGKFRYVVYCARDTGGQERLEEANAEGEKRAEGEKAADEGLIRASDGNVYVSSRNDIERETFFRIICTGLVFILPAICFAVRVKQFINALRVKAGEKGGA